MGSATAPSRVTSLVGQVIDGRYRVDSVLAFGGMGAVLRGTHLVLGQPVAIKVMLDATMRDPMMRERVFREARILAQVRSPAIASIFDAGLLPDGTIYIVMELLAGEELEGAIVRGTLTLPQMTRLLAQVCEGLADAHGQGVVHRDLKPANIFIVKKANGDTAAKLIDFGISKRVGEVSDTTTVSTIIGSPSYMSPEQASSSRDVDHRADIWSLGIILYRVVVGRLPFEGSITEVLNAIRTSAPTLPATLPPAYRAVIQRCLEKDPSRRYANASELRGALLPLAEPARSLEGADPRSPHLPSELERERARSGDPRGADGERTDRNPGAVGTSPVGERTVPDVAGRLTSAVAAPKRLPLHLDDSDLATTRLRSSSPRDTPPRAAVRGSPGGGIDSDATVRHVAPIPLEARAVDQTAPMPGRDSGPSAFLAPNVAPSSDAGSGSPRSRYGWGVIRAVALVGLGGMAAHLLNVTRSSPDVRPSSSIVSTGAAIPSGSTTAPALPATNGAVTLVSATPSAPSVPPLRSLPPTPTPTPTAPAGITSRKAPAVPAALGSATPAKRPAPAASAPAPKYGTFDP
ncbi:MAG: protein kinase [Myxococcales bacterium]|nr:protein kinase [Myxococcales bacterium]